MKDRSCKTETQIKRQEDEEGISLLMSQRETTGLVAIASKGLPVGMVDLIEETKTPASLIYKSELNHLSLVTSYNFSL